MAKKAKAKSKKLSPDERALRLAQARHKAVVRAAFSDMNFRRIPEFADREILFEGVTSDFDDIFIWKNVFVLAEYTVKKNGHSEHLKKKEFLYQKIRKNQSAFLTYICEKVPQVDAAWDKIFDKSKLQIRFIYCTTNDPDQDLKAQLPDVLFFDLPIAMYFKAIAVSIKHSGRHEMLAYLGIDHQDAGDNSLSTSGAAGDPFEGSILPESHSHMGEDFKVVSFYISPGALLERSYVLRKEGWRDSDWLYQRMIVAKKIESIRVFLRAKKRVFLNNIIVTLPSTTKLLNENGDTVDASILTKTQPVTIQIPRTPNSIGLIDGQHRVFSYHEGGKFDVEIAPLRSKLNLLVTGIIYPATLSDQDRVKFEAEVFLEINSNQTGAKSDLKQAITSILNPFDADAIAKRVLTRLNRSGALSGTFVSYFFDKQRLKTTSVVSYGIKHLVNLNADRGLFFRWDKDGKEKLLERKNLELLDEYINFCFIEINRWFVEVKAAIGSENWTYDKKVANRVLNTTNIIGLINYFRAVVASKGELDAAWFKGLTKGLSQFDFKKYKSSQYGAMGRDLVSEFGNQLVTEDGTKTPM